MRTFVRIGLLCVFMLSMICCTARPSRTSAIYINSPDSSVHAHVLEEREPRRVDPSARYYWYNRNSIFSSQGGFSGRLLHGTYTSYYAGKGLQCKGEFFKGLKTGTWLRWYNNGMISERLQFRDGLLHGAAEYFDTTGVLTMRIYYRKGARAGKTTIFSQDNRDSVIRYKNGVVVPDTKKGDADQRRTKKKHMQNLTQKNDTLKSAADPPGKRDSANTRLRKRPRASADSIKPAASQQKKEKKSEERRKWLQWLHRATKRSDEKK
jgi:hypothetical protein